MAYTTDNKALENELASIRIEGYSFSDKEIANVKKCLEGELTFEQFTAIIKQDIRTA